jgi:tetratricopeptide (TPR) repeat protein
MKGNLMIPHDESLHEGKPHAMAAFTDNLKKIVSKGTPPAYRKGVEFFQHGRYMEAIQQFDDVLREDPRSQEALIGKGKTLVRLGKYHVAIEQFERVIELNPKSVEAFFNKGIAQVSQGNIEEGLKLFDAAIALNPDFAEAWENKAISFKLLGKNDLAEICLERAMKIRGEYQEYKPLMGKWFSTR